MRRVAVALALILPLPAAAQAEPRAEAKPAEAVTTRMEGPKRDLDEIERLIRDHYHRGHELGDGELFRDLLHDKWKFFSLDAAGHLEETDKATYMSWFRPDRIDKRRTWTTEIDFIDVYRDLASVKLRIRNQSVGYTDYFNLMRIEGRWWIVHKTSQRLSP